MPGHVFAADSIPHAWLFRRMAAAVHDGGAGITGTGLSSGIPAVITPLATSQPSWARIIHQLGAGPGPLPRAHRRRVGRGHLPAVTDQQMRRRTAELGVQIQTEDGRGRIAELFTQHVCPYHGPGHAPNLTAS